MELISNFLEERLDGQSFSNKFIDDWRSLGKTGDVLKINSDLSEALSTIFCFADLFNPNEDRDSYELNEKQLRIKVEEAIRKFLN